MKVKQIAKHWDNNSSVNFNVLESIIMVRVCKIRMDSASSSFGDLPVLPVDELYPPDDLPIMLDMVDDFDFVVDDDDEVEECMFDDDELVS